MKNKGQKLSRDFQKWLLAVVSVAFFVTTVFLWIFQTKLSENNAIELLELNISDVKQDIIDASDANLLRLTHEITEDIEKRDEVTSNMLVYLAAKYGVAEISIINDDGVIVKSTYQKFHGFDMSSGPQAQEFLVLLDGEKEYVQSYQPISYDASMSRKYAGVAMKEKGGFVQVGYDAEQFQDDIDSQVVGATRNRHVGEGGCIIITDERGKIVSDRNGNEGKKLEATGLTIEPETMKEGIPFSAVVYGQDSYCMYMITEGYYILAVMPQSEAVLSRNVSVGITTAMEIVVFAALFVLIYYLIKKLIVDNLQKINSSLSEITDGNLDVVVDVRSHEEFASLSDDINSTVDTLKRYIADAETRIDAELAVAKAIQYSALPSIFPPYPNRKEIDIWAGMYTAKEVGGDFYDFYFVDEHKLVFLMADVSGKGIPAAMFMMTAKTILKSLAESGKDVHEVLAEANEKLCEGNDAEMFVTVWLGFLDTRTGLVSFANAGHNPPLVRRKDGAVQYLKAKSGFVLAMMEGMQYQKQEVCLEPGDALFLYTDGVTEAMNQAEEMYGDERLLKLLGVQKNADAKVLCNIVKEDVDRFADGAPQFDDITMLCLRYVAENREAAAEENPREN